MFQEKLAPRRPGSPNQALIQWPGEARMAVVITFDCQADEGIPLLPGGYKNYQQITERQYGGRHGIFRVLDLMDKYQVKATFLMSGAMAERYPEAARQVVQRGHEIAGHAYHHEDPYYLLSREEEREVMRKTIAAIQGVTGVRPLGWRCPKVLVTENTIELLAEEGFLWNSDFLNEDLPYILDMGKRRLVEIPYSFFTDDAPLYNTAGQPYGIPRNVFTVWQDEFDVLYQESAQSPQMFILTLHEYLSGRPSRSRPLDNFLSYMRGFPGLWFARCIDVANWWLENRFWVE